MSQEENEWGQKTEEKKLLQSNRPNGTLGPTPLDSSVATGGQSNTLVSW
jgi:hypothetical protein